MALKTKGKVIYNIDVITCRRIDRAKIECTISDLDGHEKKMTGDKFSLSDADKVSFTPRAVSAHMFKDGKLVCYRELGEIICYNQERIRS